MDRTPKDWHKHDSVPELREKVRENMTRLMMQGTKGEQKDAVERSVILMEDFFFFTALNIRAYRSAGFSRSLFEHSMYESFTRYIINAERKFTLEEKAVTQEDISKRNLALSNLDHFAKSLNEDDIDMDDL